MTDLINLLIKDIKKKKELAALLDSFVKEKLQKILDRHHKLKLEQLTPKSAGYKQIIKLVRSELRKNFGLYRGSSLNLSEELIKFKQQPENKEVLSHILRQHASTRERLEHYGKLYKTLFASTGQPKSILDLGCGLNPFSILFMPSKPEVYYAYDLSSSEIEAINEFLKIENIKGEAQVKDITNMKEFPSSDLTFLFKMTDIIDQGKGHKKTENLLRLIPSKNIIISFSTLTMSYKPMTAPRRRWVEWLCLRLRYSFKVVEILNEIFYVIRKGK